MFAWLRGHAHARDLVVVGLAIALSVSVTDELGIAPAMVLGAGLIAIANIVIGLGSRHR